MAGGPYDIYEEQKAYNPKFMPDVASWFSGPTATVGLLASDLWLIPKYMNRGSLMRSVSQPGLRRFLLRDVADRMGGVSPRHFQRYIRGFDEKAFRKTWHVPFEDMFGKAAGRRVKIGKLASSFSRFGLLFMVAELGSSLGGMLGDAITAWQPPEYQNKRRTIETGGAYVETRYAQTQRARAIQAIHNTQLSTRAALGNEASFMHLER